MLSCVFSTDGHETTKQACVTYMRFALLLMHELILLLYFLALVIHIDHAGLHQQLYGRVSVEGRQLGRAPLTLVLQSPEPHVMLFDLRIRCACV